MIITNSEQEQNKPKFRSLYTTPFSLRELTKFMTPEKAEEFLKETNRRNRIEESRRNYTTPHSYFTNLDGKRIFIIDKEKLTSSPIEILKASLTKSGS